MSFLQSLSSHVIPTLRSAFDSAKRIWNPPADGSESVVHVCASEALWSLAQMREASSPNAALPVVSQQPAEAPHLPSPVMPRENVETPIVMDRATIEQRLAPLLDGLHVNRQAVINEFTKSIERDELSLNELEHLVQLTLPLITNTCWGWERAEIFEAIGRIYPPNRESVSRLTSLLIKSEPGMLAFQRIKLMDFVNTNNLVPLERLITLTLPFMGHSRMIPDVKIEMLTALSTISPDKQESCIRFVLPLLMNTEHGWGLHCFNQLMEIFPDEWESLEFALPLFVDQEIWDVPIILRAIRAIPLADRERHIKLTLPLITKEMDGYNRRHLLEAIHSLRFADKETMVQHLKMLNRSKPGAWFLTFIITTFNEMVGPHVADLDNKIPLLFKIVDTLLNYQIINTVIFNRLRTLSVKTTAEIKTYFNEISSLGFNEDHEELKKFVSAWPPKDLYD